MTSKTLLKQKEIEFSDFCEICSAGFYMEYFHVPLIPFYVFLPLSHISIIYESINHSLHHNPPSIRPSYLATIHHPY